MLQELRYNDDEYKRWLKKHQAFTRTHTIDNSDCVENWLIGWISWFKAIFFAGGRMGSTVEDTGKESISLDATKQWPLGLCPSIPTTCMNSILPGRYICLMILQVVLTLNSVPGQERLKTGLSFVILDELAAPPNAQH